MSRADLERALWAILDTLREYLDDLILIGGWVPYLHFRYGRVANPEAGVSLTAEADLVIPPHLPGQGRRTIAGILEDAAFNPIDENRVVWGRDVQGGERIEFLLSNEGPALHAARPVPISGQPGIRGLALNLLWPLRDFTVVIILPRPDGLGEPVAIRIPSLAAFLLNKANTFHLRGGPDGELKSGKDLVYVRDVMAAGERAEAIVQGELETLMGGGEAERVSDLVRRAEYHLRNVAERYYPHAVELLTERDGMPPAAAQADLEGHLADLAALLQAASQG